MNRVAFALVTLIATGLCFAALKDVAIPAIPGAQIGLFGMSTPAGSGRHLSSPKTTVCKVNNLLDSGVGSLRHCVEVVDSPKVIVFEVSGNIELLSMLAIGGSKGTDCPTKGNYTTIAGQTAPSPGITLINYGLNIERNCHDILVQHLRIRPGDTSFYDVGCNAEPPKKSCRKSAIADPLVLVGKYRESAPAWVPPYNIVIDHNSFSWGGDMNVQSGGDRITFSNNISSEPLANPLHPKGPHSKGFYVLSYSRGKAGGQYTAIVNNLIAHSWDRNPSISSGSAVIANNLLYDLGIKAIGVDDHNLKKGPVKVSIVGNHIVDTPDLKRDMYLKAGHQTESRVYLGEDNLIAGKPRSDPWNYSGIIKCSNWPKCSRDIPDVNRAKTAEEAIWPTHYTTMPVEKVMAYVLAHAGARPGDRDAVDSRIVNDVINKKFGIIETQKDVGGWPELAKNRRVLKVPDNPGELRPSGYTVLEEWLHGYSRLVE